MGVLARVEHALEVSAGLDRLVAEGDVLVAGALVELEPPAEREQIALVRQVEALGAHHGRTLGLEVAEQQLGLDAQLAPGRLVRVRVAHLDANVHVGAQIRERRCGRQERAEVEASVEEAERVAAHGPRRARLNGVRVDAVTPHDELVLDSNVNEQLVGGKRSRAQTVQANEARVVQVERRRALEERVAAEHLPLTIPVAVHIERHVQLVRIGTSSCCGGGWWWWRLWWWLWWQGQI